MAFFLRILGYLRLYWRSIAIGLACLLLATTAGRFHPLVWRYIVDEVIAHRRVEMLVPALAAMIGAGMLGALLSAIRSNLLEKVGQRAHAPSIARRGNGWETWERGSRRTCRVQRSDGTRRLRDPRGRARAMLRFPTGPEIAGNGISGPIVAQTFNQWLSGERPVS